MSNKPPARLTIHTRHDDIRNWSDWQPASTRSSTDLPHVYGDDFIRVTELRKTLEAMKAPIAAVSWSVNSTSHVPALSGNPQRYHAMVFVAFE